MTVMVAPEGSSSSTEAYWLPLDLAIRRETPVSIPAMVTVSPSRTCESSPMMSCTEWVAASESARSRPRSGWSETYRPSMSRSKFSFSRRSQSGTSGMVTVSSSPRASSMPREPKRSNWPAASLRLTATAASTAASWMRDRERRVWPRSSKAPALMSDSMVRLLHTCSGTFFRKSLKDS